MIPVSGGLIFSGKERKTDREIRVYGAPLSLQIDHEPLLAIDINQGDWLCAARDLSGGQCLIAQVHGVMYIAFDIFTHEQGAPNHQDSLMRAAMDARVLPRG